jgi:Taurine catabolism dioxygenase TauD, TfdA family
VTSVVRVTSLTDVDAALAVGGAVLVEGLSVSTPASLADARDALGYNGVGGLERYAPTVDLGGDVYSAPEWGADREMCLHHEQAHRRILPRVLLMACAEAASAGGEMLIGDTRAVLEQLPAALTEHFRRAGWMLERNFRPYLGLPWTVAFGRSEPTELDRYAMSEGIELHWRTDNSLHTRQRRPAILRHPLSGDECWCNDVAFFSQWSVDDVERKLLLSSFGPAGIPFNTEFGDGTPLGAEQWQELIDAYESATIRVPLGEGDLLVIDNILMAHGRAPYTGHRQILVAAADPVSADPGVAAAPDDRSEDE